MPPALKDSPARSIGLRYTTSPQVAHSKDVVESDNEQDAVIYTLQNNLTRFARANNRKLLLQTFHNSKYLESVPIEEGEIPEVSDEDLEEMEAFIDESTVILNEHEVSSTRNLSLTTLLKSLVGQLCEGIPDDSELTYKILMSRLTNSTDAFFALQDLIGSSTIVLKQAHETKRPPPPGTPTLDIYQANGVIHCRVVQVVHLALFRKSDLTVNKPWMWLTCTVQERFNFSTQESVRHVSVEAPQF